MSIVPSTSTSTSTSTPDASQSAEQLCEQYRPLAVRLARRYSFGAAVDEDLLQVALLGLLAAADRFDPSVGQFRPFAVATITGELKKHLRGNGWAAHVPRRVQEAALAVDRAAEDLTQTLGRSPTPAELAERTGFGVELVLEAVRAQRARFSSALASPGRPDPKSTADDAVLDLRAAVELLPEADQELLKLCFEEELSQREIAERYDVSQSQISRRLATVLTLLRTTLHDQADA